MRVVGFSNPKNCILWSEWFWAYAEYPFPGYLYRWYRICGVEVERRTIHKERDFYGDGGL